MYITGNFDKQKIDYLRISVTDRCNLGCIYCIPRNGIMHRSHDELLTFEQILKLARIFVSLGITKIRLTGGEPLIRKGVVELLRRLAGLKGVEEVLLTTNGILLSSYAEQLKAAGLRRINISLDTLKEDKFRRITRGGSLHNTLEGIEKAKEIGLDPVKLNMVVMKGINEDEIIDFADFAFSKGVILRYIELMKVAPLWREEYVMPIEEVKGICENAFKLQRTENPDSGPAEYYEVAGKGLLGYIKTDGYNCMSCSRLRLTSMGEFKTCLYEPRGLHLKELLENGGRDDEIREAIKKRLSIKKTTDYRDWESSKVCMASVGG
ncbi:MAG: GTP 3',8-cyclase MoaA [Candidatus Omnitrophota bacterium]